MTSLTILHLGRQGSLGEIHRVRTWRQLGTQLDLDVHTVRLLDPDFATGIRRWPDPNKVRSVVDGRCSAETLAWSTAAVSEALTRRRSDIVLTVTSRAFDPALRHGGSRLVLDFVDRLSRSYGDRADVVGRFRPRGLALRALGWQHRRSERTVSVATVAAGWRDARELDARWLPVTVEIPRCPNDPSLAQEDLLFFGNLSYPPNVDAVERLEVIFSNHLSRARPSVVVAGAHPHPRVVDVVRRQGWRLVPDFDSLPRVLAQARVAVVPLRYAAGIQIKVLEAASFGLPQVLSRPAADGLDPSFPVATASTDAEFAAAIDRLLRDPVAAAAEGAAARRHVVEQYSTDAWVDRASDLFGLTR